jgi:hypothetical protein
MLITGYASSLLSELLKVLIIIYGFMLLHIRRLHRYYRAKYADVAKI